MSITAEQSTKISAAAVIEATRLCNMALATVATMGATAARVARAKRYQIEAFSRTSQRTERIVYDLLRVTPDLPADVDTRADLLAAINVYCDAGIAEVGRRFE